MEQQPPAGSAAVARGQNVIHVLPTDWAAAPDALAPLLNRIDSDASTLQLVVIVADADAAVAIVNALARSRGPEAPRAVAATGAARTARVLRAGAAPVLVGAPDQLVELLRASAIKLEGLRGFAVAWVEDVLASGGAPDLEAVMAEIPKDVPRTVITSSLSPEVEDFVERYARRAPRLGVPTARDPSSASPVAPRAAPTTPRSEPPLTYVLSTAAGRAKALERVLDEVDPPSATIYVRHQDSERTARETLRLLGYPDDGALVRVVRGPVTEHAALLVLYDLPEDAEEFRRAAGGSPARATALLQARQLRQLRSLTHEPVTPLVFTAPIAAARARDDTVRAELRRELSTGTPTRELLALEPLLAEFDGLLVAGAALRILERVRATRPPAPTAEAVRPAAPRSHDRPAGKHRPPSRSDARPLPREPR